MATGVIALHLAMLVNSYPEWDDIGHRVSARECDGEDDVQR